MAHGAPESEVDRAPAQERGPDAQRSAERREVDMKWQAPASGHGYATGRFRTPRAAARDARLVRAVLRRAGVRLFADARGLDAPCGTGRMAEALRAALGPEGRWCGADISAEMLGRVPRGARGALVRGSAFALPFEDDAFDLVLCCRFLHHHADPAARRAALGELARVSRGWVVASWWDAASWKGRRVLRGRARGGRPGTRTPIRWAELRADLAAAGLDPIARAHSLRYVSPQAFFAARTGGRDGA